VSVYSIVGDTFTRDGERCEGVYVKKTKAGRWQYRDTETGRLVASGMTPEGFVKIYWYAQEWAETPDPIEALIEAGHAYREDETLIGIAADGTHVQMGLNDDATRAYLIDHPTPESW